MMSCRKLVNSTMHTIEAFEGACDETKIGANDDIVGGGANAKVADEKMEAANDVADSAAPVPMAQPMMPPTDDRPDIRSSNTHIVKADWFWFTIQNGYANEMDHLYCDYLESIANTPDRRDSLPHGWRLQRKRKRGFSILKASNKRR